MIHFPEQGHTVSERQSRLRVRQGMCCCVYCKARSPLVNSSGTPKTSLGVPYYRPSAQRYGDLVELDKAAHGDAPLTEGDSVICQLRSQTILWHSCSLCAQ